jgi:rhodanese-related sulfurtransferase
MMKSGITAILEALFVVVVGWGIGLSANAMSEKGLPLSKNQFPSRPPIAAPQHLDQHANGEVSAVVDGIELSDEGYQIIGHAEVVAIFQGDAYYEERDIFIDARDDAHYADYHIRGAFQLDHYYSERYLDTVLPACQNAERIVVYCNGGECEDSKLAAGELMDHGIDHAKIFVYAGGIEEWTADGLPCERGERLSDDIVYPKAGG